MSRLAIIALIAHLSAPGLADAGVLPFTPKTVTLANGLRLVMVPYDSPGLIAYYSLVRTGSRDEVEKGVTGFAHFFEHMMFRGTDRYPPEKVQQLLKKAGADQNGFTTDDFTCYTFLGSNAYLEELLDYESDRFQNLKYSELDFKTESGAVAGEYRKSSSSPYLPLIEKLRASVFKKHTYGHTTMGYWKDIQDMPNQYQYSLEFFDRFYTPDNVVLIAVGDFDPAVLEGLVKTKYSGWKKKRAVTKVQAEPPQKKEIRTGVSFPSKTLPMLSMSWRAPAANFDSLETATNVILFELIFGKTSPLYTELVLEKQTVQSFDDWVWVPHRDPYLFHVVATVTKEENLAKVEERVMAEVALLAKKPIDEKRLADVKSHVRYGLLLDLDTPDSIAVLLAAFIAPTGKVDGLERLIASVEKLKPKDVQAYARKYLKESNRSIVTLVTKEDAR
jgi:zinc protease